MVTSTLPAGAMVALATPMTSGGRPDTKALARLLQHVIAGGVAGISPCGSTGEGARLTRNQRLDISRQVLDFGQELPIIPGVPATSILETQNELEMLGTLGVTAALVSPPSYFPATDSETENLYLQLASKSPIPLVLYNIPAFTGTTLKPSTVERLATHPKIIGIKDSSRDLEYLQAIIGAVKNVRPAKQFSVYTGTDTMLVASALAGADGTIAASANLIPNLGVRILELVRTDLTLAIELQQQLSCVVSACRRGSPPAGWKAALSLIGICDSWLAPPGTALSEDEIRKVWHGLHRTGIFGRELREAK